MAERAPITDPDRGGFALMLVVFLLFAIGVAGAAGYGIVRTEAAMALSDEQGSQAFTAAQAGLERFMSEYRASLPAEVTYTLPMDPSQEARAIVAPRLLRNGPLPNRTYRITSVGTFVDPRFPGSAAERTVSIIAEQRRTVVRLHAALVSPSSDIVIDDLDAYSIDGRDTATSTECSFGGTIDVLGVVGSGTISISPGNAVAGSPNTGGPPRERSYGTPEAVMDSLDVRWDVLTSSSFPVEHDDTWPSFATIPADSFPVIRWNGALDADASRVGRGLLIVNGTLNLVDGFVWDGIVMADRLQSPVVDEDFAIRGTLITGLDGSGDPVSIQNDGQILFHSCNVARAGAGLSHFIPLSGTWWEEF